MPDQLCEYCRAPIVEEWLVIPRYSMQRREASFSFSADALKFCGGECLGRWLLGNISGRT